MVRSSIVEGAEMNVLVVADDPNLASLWGGTLREGGHAVRVADTEATAMALLRDVSHDLIVMDLCAKGRGKLDHAMQLARRNPSCKVVVVSGSAGYSREALHAMSPAIAATLRKPVDIEDLVEVCETVGRKGRPALNASGAGFRQ